MKFRCDRDALSEALQTVQRGVSSRPGIPALTGVLLDATDAGQLTLTTTDLEVSARLTIDVQVTEAGTALVPARLLGDTVKSLSEAPVDVETDPSQARIRCAAYEGSSGCCRRRTSRGCRSPVGTRSRSTAAAFAEAVSQVGRAASARRGASGAHRRARGDQPGGLTWSRPTPTGWRCASWSPRPTARRRRSCRSVRCPRRAGPRRPTRRATVEISVDESQVSFRAGGLTLTSRLIEGEFPNYRQLLPEGYESRLMVSRQQLLERCAASVCWHATPRPCAWSSTRSA